MSITLERATGREDREETAMKWTTFVGGIVGVWWLLSGCTEKPESSNLDQLVDADLARLMSHRCYDFKAAYRKTQDRHMSFEETIQELKHPYLAMRPITQAMQHRSNKTLQFIRKYALEGGLQVLEACALAEHYEQSTDRPMLDYHSGLGKHRRDGHWVSY
jgi:hypothetical protein